ncbi:MAG: tetratricopeptide repeat protein [Sedimenticolaceae bacterium]
MTLQIRLFLVSLIVAILFGCSESTPPNKPRTLARDEPSPKVVMTPPPVPAAVVEKLTVKESAETQPAGPHGQHDPHGTLDSEQLAKVALQHESEGRLELALQTLAEGIGRYPDAAQLYAVRASLRLQMQQVSAALSDLEQAAQLAPDDAKIRVNRAQAYRAFGRYDEAMQDLDFAVSRSPDLLPARFNRGALLYAQNQFDKALVDFDHCVAVDPHSPAPYFNRASTYWELQRVDEAIGDLEHFIELNENVDWEQTARTLLKGWRDNAAKLTATSERDT